MILSMQRYEKILTKRQKCAHFRFFSLVFGIFLLYFFLIWQKCCYFAPDFEHYQL